MCVSVRNTVEQTLNNAHLSQWNCLGALSIGRSLLFNQFADPNSVHKGCMDIHQIWTIPSNQIRDSPDVISMQTMLLDTWNTS